MTNHSILALAFWVLLVMLWLKAFPRVSFGRFDPFIVPLLFLVVGFIVFPLLKIVP